MSYRCPFVTGKGSRGLPKAGQQVLAEDHDPVESGFLQRGAAFRKGVQLFFLFLLSGALAQRFRFSLGHDRKACFRLAEVSGSVFFTTVRVRDCSVCCPVRSRVEIVFSCNTRGRGIFFLSVPIFPGKGYHTIGKGRKKIQPSVDEIAEPASRYEILRRELGSDGKILNDHRQDGNDEVHRL